MNEIDLQRHLKAGMTEQRMWNYKITDSQVGVKPLDIVANMNGKFAGIETKLVKTDKFTQKKYLLSPASFKGREHQLRELREISQQTGMGLIVVGYYQTQYPWEKHCWAVDVAFYDDGDVLTMEDMDASNNEAERLILKGGTHQGVRWWFPKGFVERHS